MNKNHLSKEVKEFIQTHIQASVADLALQKHTFPPTTWRWILNQIQARQKAHKKLPEWSKNFELIFPPALSVEQATAEQVAKVKARLFSGKNAIDLTGGFGIDSYYLSQSFESFTYCEYQQEVAEIAAYNFEKLGAKHITIFQGDGLEYLSQTDTFFDCIYLDPARRDQHQRKVFLFEDCTPNIIEIKEELFQKTNKIALKSSPMFDISMGIETLQQVEKIYIISYKNEVKELLWILAKAPKNIEIETIEISEEQPQFTRFSYPIQCKPIIAQKIQKYLYEPHAAIMKSGAYDCLCTRFNIQKIHPHTHLFTSQILIENFPGRTFELVRNFPFNKSEMKKWKGQSMHITTRNFPMTVEQIRKKFQLKDGGTLYTFFATDSTNQKIVLIGNKV